MSTVDADPMIRLDGLTKRYGDVVAVAELDLTVPRGEIVVLVGPSGCGKTTTLEMINRLVEPTSGRILLEGEDVTDADVDTLRRRIGYVIQQIGLFPHRTIADNVATVPRLLGWKRERIGDRIDELLDLVGLEPASFRDRYPSELSGGQRQRVGLARAMAGDPPVMLMDEPFGATDPITRARLQREFVEIQRSVEKTVVFVTHDIDEAIRMGDRIAILQEQSVIAQFDTPEHILSAPAGKFVADFLGSGALLKRLQLAEVADLETVDDWPTLPTTAGSEEVTTVLQRSDRDWILVLDDDRRPQRWLETARLREDQEAHTRPGEAIESMLTADTSLDQALQQMLISASAAAVVVDEADRFQGVLYMETLNRAMRSMRDEACASRSDQETDR